MAVDSRYQVFISSTYEDLRVERQQATQAILEMNHMPAGMELFPASDLSQWELIKTVINESDYYVVIVAGRYGSIHIESGLSFTEMEYDYAIAQSIPVLGFVRKDITNIASKHVDADLDQKLKLDAFRAKVMSRTCRLFEDPSELGMQVMKSLMNEMRTNPRMGWVRADQALGKEDIEREKALVDEVAKKDRIIVRLERQIRDISLPLDGISSDQLSQGEDICPLDVTFLNSNKQLVACNPQLSWDEVFGVIAPAMYGFILRRGQREYNKLFGTYTFESYLVEYIRTKVIKDCGGRQINLLPHQIDSILIQFKQLGLIRLEEKTTEEDGEDFRGYCLTSAGEEHLTRLKISLRN